MKFIIPISVLLITAFLVTRSSFVNPDTENTPEIGQTIPHPTPTPAIYPSVFLESTEYAYLLKKNIDANDVILINNNIAKADSQALNKDNLCVSGINGGFYDENNKPIGWMVIDGRQISEIKSSQLFNGYAMISDGNLRIAKIGKLEQPEAVYGLQSGPLLYEYGKQLELAMARDKPARRMVLGQAAGGMFFLSIFKKDAETAGPNLADLPEILTLISSRENLKVISALNMDGGSASAIYVPTGTLREIAPVGSWWCEK